MSVKVSPAPSQSQASAGKNRFAMNMATTTIASLMVALLLVSVVADIMRARVERAMMENETKRYASHMLANSLRRSSDELTRMARSYVATGDRQFYKYYIMVRDIRSGHAPRPVGYDRVFWDFVLADAGELEREASYASWKQMASDAGFTEAELKKLEESYENSEVLVKLEEESMNAVAFLVTASGAEAHLRQRDAQKAVSKLYSAEYHRHKARIMRPIDEIFSLIDQRFAELRKKHSVLSVVLGITLSAAVGGVLILLIFANFYLIRPLLYFADSIRNQVKIDKSNLGSFIPREISELVDHYNNMLQKLREERSMAYAQVENLASTNRSLKRRTVQLRRSEQIENSRVVELNEKVEDLNLFVSMASKNLLAQFQNIDTLTRKLTDPESPIKEAERNAYIHQIRDDGAQIQGLLSDLRALNNMDTKALSTEKIDIKTQFEEIAASYENANRIEQHTFRGKTQNSKITVYPRLFYQLLYSLVDSAVRNSRTTPEIYLTHSRGSGNVHNIQFVSTGKFQAKDNLEAEKAEDDEPQFDQMGNGLKICQRIVELHEGKIEFDQQSTHEFVANITIRANSKLGMAKNE